MGQKHIGTAAVYRVLTLAALLALAPGTAGARLVIGPGVSRNMVCSGGFCAPTAANAVLNVSDLETLLASGNVTVTTTGSGVQAGDIAVQGALSWQSSGALTLEAYRSLIVTAPVSVTGIGGLVLATNGEGTNGALFFGGAGNVGFANLSSSLIDNGTTYALVDSVAGLAKAVASRPSGAFAFAASYDASPDGTYSSAPVPTDFRGEFEGLGNVISNLKINKTLTGSVGLFAQISARGAVRDIGLDSPDISGEYQSVVGALAGTNAGAIANSFVTGGSVFGEVTGGLVGLNSGTISNSLAASLVTGGEAGGLAGENYGTIARSYASGGVVGNHGVGNVGGGLVGINEENAELTQSFATGPIASSDGQYDCVYGGLVGQNAGAISQSYATGSTTVGPQGQNGGLVGQNSPPGTIAQSYSSGAVSTKEASYAGGLLGFEKSGNGDLTNTYWDTTASGIGNLSQGSGNIANEQGITGLSDTTLRSGLPKGFLAQVWSERAKINGGLPYLRANPPPH